MKLLETRQRPLSFFLLLSFIVWVNSAVFPVRAQERTPDSQALNLIDTGRALYQQKLFDEALNKLNEALDLAQGNETKSLANLEMAYVKFLQQGTQLPVFRFLVEEALKLNPAIIVQAGNYKPGFLEAFQAVKADVLKVEKPVVEKPVLERAGSANVQAKKRHFPWLGVILSLALVGGLVYYFLILKTTLQVDTIPSGAKVYLDGTNTAKITPCQLEPSLGSHTIKVSLEGYADLEREFVVKNGKNSLTILLDLGTYSISAPAANANVQRAASCTISWDSTAPAALATTVVTAVSPAAVQPMGVTSVDLELYQEESKVADIVKGVANSGSYSWNVPASTAEGHNFKIHIVSPAASESQAFGPAFNLLGFKEDFSDNVADFWLPDNATSWNTAGGYFTGSKTTEWGGCAVYDFFYSETSYTVESRMRWSEFSGSSNPFLFIMLATSKNLTSNAGYLLGYAIDGTVSIYSLINFKFTEPPLEPPTPLFSAKSTAVNLGINNWNTLKVVHVDSTYTLYINDTMTYTFVDSTYNPNYLVLGFIGAGTKTSCDFDYVTMTVDPSTPKPGPETLSRRRR
ncbi:MAG: PEGA domain-containing protein [Candidatus Aminicenantes bacterium]|nr:PEGA domain-containing protein [Candidatus Aminicenantes bacterium]